MMGYGLFAAQKNDAIELFDQLDILTSRASPEYGRYGAAYFRSRSYADIWKICYRERIFDAQLNDDALIQFRFDRSSPGNVSYAFLDCPFVKPMQPDEYSPQEIGASDEIDEYDSWEDYELRPIERKDAVTPVRYDYSPNIYVHGRHPAAHMHFGHANNIRIATRKILRPISFALFIVRQFYPDQWTDFLKFTDAEVKCRNVQHSLDNIEPKYFQLYDSWEMHLV